MLDSKMSQFFMLLLTGVFSQFAVDVYAPSVPAIAVDLKTSINNVQWTISVYMFGVAGMQFFYGAMSEVVGRKAPMILGMVIMLIGSIICINAIDIETLIIGRLIQGVGVSACACLWRSVLRDSFSGDELSKYASYATMIIMFIIPGAPLFGGFIQDYFGWQANFLVMIIYSVIVIILLLFGIKETSLNHHASKISIKIIIANYLILLRSPLFMGTIFAVFLSFGAFFSWFVIGPVLLIDRIGISPSEFGIISFICGVIGFGLGGYINGKCVKKHGMHTMLRFGWSVMIFAGVLLFFGHFIFGLELLAMVIPVALFFFGSSFIWPNAFATAFSPFGHVAGYAGALYGTTQVSGGAVLASIFAYLPDNDQLVFSIIITVSTMIAWALYEFLVFPNIKKI
ncbi:MAG: multidrug effflux MFS transporter [Rickettsiaceae bacterium]|nr:multidrug effflux MFS transporter [Rickettsiaceae bacterium]MDP5020829.1 multidrug effflux MFS transporter [Rickettsiaceae bacterium]MDP5083359.1 multidrug effflux MFS transporter [Rickettsiaceae bacterium]